MTPICEEASDVLFCMSASLFPWPVQEHPFLFSSRIKAQMTGEPLGRVCGLQDAKKELEGSSFYKELNDEAMAEKAFDDHVAYLQTRAKEKEARSKDRDRKEVR